MEEIPTRKDNITKIYCEECNSVFETKKKYVEHYKTHGSISSGSSSSTNGGVYCESCPLDVVIQKIVNLFKKGMKKNKQ